MYGFYDNPTDHTIDDLDFLALSLGEEPDETRARLRAAFADPKEDAKLEEEARTRGPDELIFDPIAPSEVPRAIAAAILARGNDPRTLDASATPTPPPDSPLPVTAAPSDASAAPDVMPPDSSAPSTPTPSGSSSPSLPLDPPAPAPQEDPPQPPQAGPRVAQPVRELGGRERQDIAGVLARRRVLGLADQAQLADRPPVPVRRRLAHAMPLGVGGDQPARVRDPPGRIRPGV